MVGFIIQHVSSSSRLFYDVSRCDLFCIKANPTDDFRNGSFSVCARVVLSCISVLLFFLFFLLLYVVVVCECDTNKCEARLPLPFRILHSFFQVFHPQTCSRCVMSQMHQLAERIYVSLPLDHVNNDITLYFIATAHCCCFVVVVVVVVVFVCLNIFSWFYFSTFSSLF